MQFLELALHVLIPYTCCLWVLSSCFFALVCSMKEYEERAVSLALNRPKLQSLTNRLKAARMTCPLFDTRRWVILSWSFLFCNYNVFCMYEGQRFNLLFSQMQVRNLDRAYFKMWSIHCSGQQPHHFKVAENDFDFP